MTAYIQSNGKILQKYTNLRNVCTKTNAQKGPLNKYRPRIYGILTCDLLLVSPPRGCDQTYLDQKNPHGFFRTPTSNERQYFPLEASNQDQENEPTIVQSKHQQKSLNNKHRYPRPHFSLLPVHVLLWGRHHHQLRV